MADVTVNISGNADGLKREIEDVGRRAREVENGVNDVFGKTPPPPGVFPGTGTREVVPPTPGGSTTTPSRQPDIIPDRVVDEMRREAENRQLKPGSQEFNNAVEELQKTSQERLDQDITAKYSQRRSDLTEEMNNAYRKIDDDVDRQKNERIQMIGQQAYNDPLRKPQIDQEFEDLRDVRYRDVGKRFDEQFDKIDEDEKNERTQSEAQLTEAIRQLTEELGRIAGTQTSDPNSFINRLREERRQAIQERDNAPSEEEAQQAQRRVNEIDGRLRRIQGGEETGQGGQVGQFGGANVASGINAVNSAASGDLAGTFTSGAMMLGARAFIPAAIIAGLIKSMQIGSENIDQAGDLARLRGTTGTSGAGALNQINQQFSHPVSGGRTIGDLGLDEQEFRTRAMQTIRASGSSQDWVRNTFESAAVEKNLGLNEGALVQGSQYDRYGKNVIDAILDLTNTLSEIRTSGVTGNDFTRVQERFDIQQGIMAGYMNRTDKPDYDVANRLLAGFSAVPVTQDQRTGTDIQDFQQAIQNPMNDRMRALLYGVIGDLAPETQGRVDLAERYRLDPENEGRLIQATVQRVTQMYGGTQTTQGFMAFRSLFPNIAPERLDQYINAFQNPDSEASKRLIEELKTGNRVVSREESVQTAPGYVSDMSKFTVNFSTDAKNFLEQQTKNLTDAFKDPSTIAPNFLAGLMSSLLPFMPVRPPLNQ